MSTVLIVDDDIYIVELLTDVVVDAGHTPIAATNGYDALVLARSHLPRLIISDIMMPIMDGYELLMAVRSDPLLADTTFVFISAGFGAAPLGMETAFVPKPLDLGVIESFLQEL